MNCKLLSIWTSIILILWIVLLYIINSEKIKSIKNNFIKEHFTSVSGSDFGIDEDVFVNPFSYELRDNFPNPFNPETHIRFSMGGKEVVKLIIYDIRGQQIRSLINGELYDPGFHSVHWNGLDNDGQKVPSGMYIYRIKAGGFVADKKMLLLK